MMSLKLMPLMLWKQWTCKREWEETIDTCQRV